MWPGDAIWLWWSWSTLVQVMTCCLTAPSHYLNHCWVSSLRSGDIRLTAISLETSQPTVTEISLKIIFLRFYWNSPGTNKLMGPGNFTPPEHFIFQVQFPTCRSIYGQSCMDTEPEISHLCVSKFSVAKQFYADYIFFSKFLWTWKISDHMALFKVVAKL